MAMTLHPPLSWTSTFVITLVWGIALGREHGAGLFVVTVPLLLPEKRRARCPGGCWNRDALRMCACLVCAHVRTCARKLSGLGQG